MTGTGRSVSRRGLLAGAGGLLAAGSLSGCMRGLTLSSGKTQSLQMTFWGEGDQNTKLIAAIDLFERRNPGVTVQTQYSGLNGYYDKLATRLAGGSPPDLFQIHLPFLLEYERRGVVLNLDRYARELGLPDAPDYITTTSKVDGHWYFALVGAATQPAVIVNRSKLEQYGLELPSSTWTLTQFRQVMNKVTGASHGKLMGTADQGGVSVPFESYIRGTGKKLFSDSGGLGFSEDDFATWLRFWDDMRKEKSCVPMTITAASTGFDSDPLVLGKSAYTVTATSRGFPSIQTLTRDTLGIAPWPAANSKGTSGTNIIPAGWFAISKRSQNVEKAVALLKFLGQDPSATQTMGLARGVPISASLRAEIGPSMKGNDKIVFDNYQQIAAGKPSTLQAYPPGAGQLLTTSISTANQSVGFGRASVDKAVDQFFTDAKRLLKK